MRNAVSQCFDALYDAGVDVLAQTHQGRTAIIFTAPVSPRFLAPIQWHWKEFSETAHGLHLESQQEAARVIERLVGKDRHENWAMLVLAHSARR